MQSFTININDEAAFYLKKAAQSEKLEVEDFIIKALRSYIDERRIQGYKEDIELLKQGKLKTYTAEEVFGEIERHIKEIAAKKNRDERHLCG